MGERRQAEIDEIRKRKEAADLILEKQREREREIEAKQKRKEDESREKEREAREKDREQTRDVRGGGERERQTEGSSWRRGGESAPAAAAAEIRSSEPYRPPTEARWRDKTRDKYSRPEPETERRPDTDERRDPSSVKNDPNLPAGGALEMLQLPNPVCAIASPSVRWSAASAISLLFATPVLRKRWNSNVAMTTAVCAVEEMIANS